MPRFKYATSNGKSLILEGDSQPSDADVEQAAKAAGVSLVPAEGMGSGVGDTMLGGLAAAASAGAGAAGSMVSHAVQHPIATAEGLALGKYLSPSLIAILNRAAPVVGRLAGQAMNVAEGPVGVGLGTAAATAAVGNDIGNQITQSPDEFHRRLLLQALQAGMK